ncbi:MAG: hypothetical protein K0R71_1054 [Bacillales bacterium]|jgi:hypothetical protein|nr:hypothetical protein [Bacillales bacterium]
MKGIYNRIVKLLEVKSIVTLMLTTTLVAITLLQIKPPELFNNVTLMVIGFFFGKASNNAKNILVQGKISTKRKKLDNDVVE